MVIVDGKVAYRSSFQAGPAREKRLSDIWTGPFFLFGRLFILFLGLKEFHCLCLYHVTVGCNCRIAIHVLRNFSYHTLFKSQFFSDVFTKNDFASEHLPIHFHQLDKMVKMFKFFFRVKRSIHQWALDFEASCRYLPCRCR